MRHPISRFIETHPFVRMLLPLMAGIVVVDMADGLCHIPFVCVLATLGLAILLLTVTFWKSAWRRSMGFGVLSFSFFFLLGGALCSRQWREVLVDWPQETRVYEGVVLEDVTEKPRSFLCPMHLVTQWQGDTCRAMDTDVYLYLPKDHRGQSLRPGYTVRFYGQISSPTNTTPDFDYARFLRHHQVCGTLYTQHWQLVDTVSQDWKCRALQVRNRLLDYCRQSGLTGEEGAVFSALALGYKKELDEGIRQQYNISGASHVLALSGLHVGIVCVVFSMVIGLVFPRKRNLLLRKLLLLPMVWGFVFMVGLPVSAVRAAIMFSCLLLSSCFNREGVPLNTLALTAFGMLVYNPFYLFDVGFQMSFMAVAAILLLQSWIWERIPRSNNVAVRYFWGITSTSLAAQMGVIPLILYYFSRFSPYALLVNLWVVPLTWLIVCLAVPFLLLSLFPFSALQMATGWCISQIVYLMNVGIYWCNRLPGADVCTFSFSGVDMVCTYGVMALLFYGLKYRNRRVVIGILLCGCVSVGWHLIEGF